MDGLSVTWLCLFLVDLLEPCSQIHEHFYEVPAPIRDYIQEVKSQLAMLTDWPEGGVDLEEKLAFLRETRHAFGRTALLLSGGGGLGSFHLVRIAACRGRRQRC